MFTDLSHHRTCGSAYGGSYFECHSRYSPIKVTYPAFDTTIVVRIKCGCGLQWRIGRAVAAIQTIASVASASIFRIFIKSVFITMRVFSKWNLAVLLLLFCHYSRAHFMTVTIIWPTKKEKVKRRGIFFSTLSYLYYEFYRKSWLQIHNFFHSYSNSPNASCFWGI